MLLPICAAAGALLDELLAAQPSKVRRAAQEPAASLRACVPPLPQAPPCLHGSLPAPGNGGEPPTRTCRLPRPPPLPKQVLKSSGKGEVVSYQEARKLAAPAKADAKKKAEPAKKGEEKKKAEPAKKASSSAPAFKLQGGVGKGTQASGGWGGPRARAAGGVGVASGARAAVLSAGCLGSVRRALLPDVPLHVPTAALLQGVAPEGLQLAPKPVTGAKAAPAPPAPKPAAK